MQSISILSSFVHPWPLLGFPVFCSSSSIVLNRYFHILVNSMTIWSVLKLPKIAWPSPFNVLIIGHPGGLTLGNPQAFAPGHLQIPPTQCQSSSHKKATTLTSACVYYTGLYTQSPQSGSFIFKMAAMQEIQRVFPCVYCLRSARWVVQCPWPRAKNWQQKSANPVLFPRMSPWSTPRGRSKISA